MKKILVLGGNGFIGSNLVNELLKVEDNKIYVVARIKKNEIQSSRITYIYCDFNNLVEHTDLFRKMDCVYHLISQSYPFTTWEIPMAEVELNLLPTLKFLESIAGFVPLVIFVSSGGTIYGNHSQISSETSIPKPNNPHGIIKLCIENFLLYYHTKSNMNFLIFRVSNVYGPGQEIKKGLGFINTAIEKIIANDSISIFGDGNQTRDFIFIQDVAKILTAALYSKVKNKIYNLSYGTSTSLNKILTIISNELERPILINRHPKREFDLKLINIDNSCLINDFKNIQLTKIELGIQQTINYILKHQHGA